MNSIKKNATLNVIKQICTILFPLITFPYATRILQTENYGMYTFSSSVVSYFTLIAGLGVTNYAVREGARIRNNKTSIISFVDEVFSVNIISTAISYIALILLILFWRKLDSYIAIILILSSSIAFTTLGTDWINIIYEDYEYITKRYIICHVLAIIFLFLTVKDTDDTIFYAISTVIGVVSANIFNIIYIRKRYGLRPKIRIDKKVLIHITPILILFANSIASTIYLNSDVTILGIIKDNYAVAIYGVSSRIYMMVKGIANAAITVIIPRIASLITKDNIDGIRSIYKKTLGSVVLLILPAMVGLIFLSADIVRLISGAEYIDAAKPLVILSCALPFATSACLFINGILIPYRKERIALQLTVVSALINIVLNFILIPSLSFSAAALTTLLAELFMFCGGLIATKKIITIDVKKELMLSVVTCCIVALTCKVASMFVVNFVIRIFVSMLFSVAFYTIFLCVVKNNIVYDTVRGIMKRVTR